MSGGEGESEGDGFPFRFGFKILPVLFMNSFLKVGQTNKLPKGGDVMFATTLALACLYFGSYYLMFAEDEKRVKIVNQVLSGKGYVKSYNSKEKFYVVGLSVGSSFKDLENLKGALENVLKSDVEITNNNFQYCIKPVTKKVIPSLIPFKLFATSHEIGMKVAVAMGSEGVIYLDLTKVPHTLIAGATGWGKSIFTKNLILQIINNFPSTELELFDFKAGIELGDFKDLKQTKSFIIRPYLAEDEIERIYGEIEDRFATINATNSRDWMAHNKKSSNKMNPKIIVIEEFTILLDQSKEVSTTLTKCLAIARAVGVFFIFTSQRFDAKIIDPKIKANIDNRICFHTADGTNSKVILDITGAEKLNVIGRCLISVAGVIQEGQSFYVKEDDVVKYTESHIIDRRATKEVEMINNSSQNKKALYEPKMSDNEGVILWD